MRPIIPDVTNTEPEYWEMVLESYGLGKTQLQLDEEPQEEAE